MEWVILVVVILAIPVMAVVAFIKSQNNERELRRIGEQLDRTRRELGELSTRIEQFGARTPDAEPVASEGLTPKIVDELTRKPFAAEFI